MGIITDWLLKEAEEKVDYELKKHHDLEDIKTLTWTYRFKTYEEAKAYVDAIRNKYPYDLDVENYTHQAGVYAEFYFHKR